MQSFGTLLTDNKGLAIAAGLLAVVVVIAILIFLFRLAFGRRLHMTSGRSRQPRLGVVDAFDLDRQRQLVLVRRDNVEHLLMIGGPNDLVIESAFVRAQPSVVVSVGRDKEASTPAAPLIPIQPTESVAGPAENRTAVGPPSIDPPQPPAQPARPELRPLDATVPVSSKDLGPLADLPAPGPVERIPPPEPLPEPATETAAESSTPPIAGPSRPAPPARSVAPPSARPTGSLLPPRPPLSSLRTPSMPAAPTTRPASLLPNRPTPSIPLQRGTSAASLRRDPPPSAPTADGGGASQNGSGNGGAGTKPEAAALPPTRPVSTAQSDEPGPTPDPKAGAGFPITLDSIESLEEEMAKLLGRASGGEQK